MFIDCRKLSHIGHTHRICVWWLPEGGWLSSWPSSVVQHPGCRCLCCLGSRLASGQEQLGLHSSPSTGRKLYPRALPEAPSRSLPSRLARRGLCTPIGDFLVGGVGVLCGPRALPWAVPIKYRREDGCPDGASVLLGRKKAPGNSLGHLDKASSGLLEEGFHGES